MENRLKTICKGFGNNFVENIALGDGSKIFYCRGIRNFRDKDNGWLVYLKGKGSIFQSRCNCSKNIWDTKIPIFFL